MKAKIAKKEAESKKKKISEAISLFPKPAQDQIAVQWTGHSFDRILIRDAQGRRLSDQQFESVQGKKTFDISSLVSGMYIITLFEEGSKTHFVHAKFVKTE